MRPSKRKKPLSTKTRNVKRRFERQIAKLIRKSEQLQLLYADPKVRIHSSEIESLLRLFYLFGMADGGHMAFDLMKTD